MNRGILDKSRLANKFCCYISYSESVLFSNTCFLPCIEINSLQHAFHENVWEDKKRKGEGRDRRQEKGSGKREENRKCTYSVTGAHARNCVFVYLISNLFFPIEIRYLCVYILCVLRFVCCVCVYLCVYTRKYWLFGK